MPSNRNKYSQELREQTAIYVYRDGYSGHDVELPQVSETIRYLLKKMK
jgi:transposase